MNMKFILTFCVIAGATENSLAQKLPSNDIDWTTKAYSKAGGELKYLGTSNNESSENSALIMAEQDAITQMIKHYFGVKMKYSLSASESLSSISLNIDKAESSDSIELRGMVRVNLKVEKIESGNYREWVQISIPEKNLREEKQRLENLRKLQAYSDHLKKLKRRADEQKGKVPLLFIGMSRDLFVKSYPAPNSVIGSYPYEAFHYKGWNFCDGGFLGCYIHFTDGRLSRWDSVNPKFIDFARSVSP